MESLTKWQSELEGAKAALAELDRRGASRHARPYRDAETRRAIAERHVDRLERQEAEREALWAKPASEIVDVLMGVEPA